MKHEPGPLAVAVAEAVALEAQPRAHHLQRVLVHGAVRIVTVVAVLAHRLVFEQERSALLGVAGVANVVDRNLSSAALR